LNNTKKLLIILDDKKNVDFLAHLMRLIDDIISLPIDRVTFLFGTPCIFWLIPLNVEVNL